jgi:hypothetical protein
MVIAKIGMIGRARRTRTLQSVSLMGLCLSIGMATVCDFQQRELRGKGAVSPTQIGTRKKKKNRGKLETE